MAPVKREPDLTLEEVAEQLRVSVGHAQKLRRIGWFPNAYNVSTSQRKPHWRIPQKDVDAIRSAGSLGSRPRPRYRSS